MARARGVSTTAGQIEGLTASLRLYHQTRGDEHGRHLITDPDIGPKITWISITVLSPLSPTTSRWGFKTRLAHLSARRDASGSRGARGQVSVIGPRLGVVKAGSLLDQVCDCIRNHRFRGAVTDC